MRQRLPAVCLSIGLLLASSLAFAGASTDVIKSRQTALVGLLKADTPENQKKVAAIFDELFDDERMAKDSLGSEWAARSPAEQQQYRSLLKQLVRKGYERNMKKTLGYEIEYLSEQPKAGGVVVVKTKAVSKSSKGEPVETAFTMAQVGGKWKVQDFTVDGVSTVSSYRSQFTKIIKKDGFPTLITKMKDKIAKGDV